MAVGVEKLIYSSAGLKVAAAIARATPPGIGYAFAGSAARWICSRGASPLVDAVRRNQQMLAGADGSSPQVNEAVEAVFRHAANSVYELYHWVEDREAVEAMYCIDLSFQPLLRRREFERRGLLIAGLHMAGFDLGLRWLCRYKFKPLVLTMPDPRAGRRLELEGRRAMQMNVLPFSGNALRWAIRHLQQGGMVLTGIDHPAPGSDIQPCFLGQPAALPTDHIYLALRAQVPVVVVGSRLEQDGKYHVYSSAPIEMDRYASRSGELRLNAEKVLDYAGYFIRKAPQQWLIFQQVWPGIAGAAATE